MTLIGRLKCLFICVKGAINVFPFDDDEFPFVDVIDAEHVYQLRSVDLDFLFKHHGAIPPI